MRVDGQLINAGTEVVSTLPTTNLFYGRKVLLSTDDTIYQYVGGNWEAIGAEAGSSTFIELTDTPENYAGQAGSSLFVNQTEDGLIYGTTGFTDLNDTPSNYSSSAGKLVAVNNTENGLEYVDKLARFTELVDTPTSYLGQADKIVSVNSGETGLEFIDAPSGGGSTTFTGLTDTPADYVGQASRFVRVNAGETGLEFVVGTGGGASTFTDLSDTPNAYTGEGSKTVRVKADETGLEFVTSSGGGADELVKVSANDTTAGYLNGKLVAGTNITLTENNDGLNETLTINAASGGGATTFVDLTDTPTDYLGQADKIVSVRTDESGLQFIDAPSGGGGGVIPADEQGQMIRSTGTLDGEYEWITTNELRWSSNAGFVFFNIGSIDQDVRTYFTGNTTVEGNFSQVEGMNPSVGIDCTNITVRNDLDADVIVARETFFQNSQFGLFDVAADFCTFSGNLDIFQNCNAMSYTQNGIPIATLIEDAVVESINTKYEDKYNESITLNSSSDATNILMTYSDLEPGNSYKVNASLLLKWTANSSGTPNLKYKVKIQDAATVFRSVEHEEILDFNDIVTQSWTFTFSFQATEPTLSLIVETDIVEHDDIASGLASGVGMTVEEFETDVRIRTTEW